MAAVQSLPAEALAWQCDPNQFEFQTTDELEDLDEILGQQRATRAVQFGIGIRHEGYNIYALGPPGTGKRAVVEQFLSRAAEREPVPPDWCYVNNFENPHKPRALQLPSGRGPQLHQAMETLVDDFRTAIPAALASEEHSQRLEEIEREFKEQHDRAFNEVAKNASQRGIDLVRTPGGFSLAPTIDGEVISAEDFEKLPEEEQRRIQGEVAELQEPLQQVIESVPELKKAAHDKAKELNQEVIRFSIGHLMAQVKEPFSDLANVVDYLNKVEEDVIKHADEFEPEREESALIFEFAKPEKPSFRDYTVNVLVDNTETSGAPIIDEEHPNFQNLLGRVEHQSQMGSLLTDFTLIKAGALHRANGGYLVVDAMKILLQPYAWEGLKRALRAGHVKIESLAESLSLVSTVTLDPEPIPLDVKIVLLGDRMLYYMLHQHDPDFPELFKVAADFEDRMDRSQESCQLYARLLATMARRDRLRPFDRAAIARLIEHSARLAGDAEKLSIHFRTVTDVLREADYWAGQQGAPAVTADHVRRAIDGQIHRADRIRERLQEEIERGTLLIDTEGEKVGQVNGLSVINLGNFAFGQPSRITATARLGKGEVVDIEREVELGGAIHSKGMSILSSLLAARYAQNHPLSLSASVVFEQSYGMVEGDSASVAELCALLSALSNLPIKQSLAVTGSVNQHGQVQAIGGVNEKIEGFFDVCCRKGLTGDQGVLVPASNVKHLMLRQDVRQAVEAGRFRVDPIETIDHAVSLLTGVEAGERDAQGNYPPNTINCLVETRLVELSRLRQEYAETPTPEIPDE